MKTTTGGTRLSCGAALGLIMLVVLASSGSGQTFSPTGSMNVPRNGHTATLLTNGMVLIAGGTTGSGPIPVASAELYDPATGTFSLTGNMSTPRVGARAVRLNNGKVLISGGTSETAALDSAELYDPETGEFTSAGLMTIARYQATVSLLNDGKVLIAGGWTGLTGPPGGYALASTELYDPVAGTFTPAGSMTTPRYLHTAAVLNNGKVLLVGGSLVPNYPSIAGAELFDPEEGSFTATSGSLLTVREYPVTEPLRDGKVLIAGGWRNFEPYHLSEAEIFDPTTNIFTETGSMTIDRYGHTGTVLKDGKVLIAGGSSLSFPWSTMAELYDPATGKFTPTGSMSVLRGSHTASLLDNGEVLIAGGGNSSGTLASAELYSPELIFTFEGFFAPIDNPPTLNKAKAGQAIPVKWRLTDMNGQPVSDPASFVGITSFPVSCETFAGDSTSAVTEYVAGSSGLQYLGDGWWQFNWKTPMAYVGQCRTMKLSLADNKEYTANFSFK